MVDNTENDRRRNSRHGSRCHLCTCLQNGDDNRWYSMDPEKIKQNRQNYVMSYAHNMRNYIMRICEQIA